MPVLQVSGVYRSFGGVRALAGADLSAPRGKITGLIGPNGAGKSTLCAVVTGGIPPETGSVRFDGADVTGLAPHRVARRGLIRTFQLTSEFSRLTVLENLVVSAPRQRGETVVGALLGRRYWGAQESRLVDQARNLLVEFDLLEKANEYAGRLSGGQRRLVEIMRGLMAQPKMLVLDEPMVGVHPHLAGRIGEHLKRLRDDGLSILLIEHELGIVEDVCDTVFVMAQGRVIAQGTIADLRNMTVVTDAYLFV